MPNPLFAVRVNGVPKPQGSKNAYLRGGKAIVVEASAGVKEWRQNVIQAVQDPKGRWAKVQWTESCHILLDFYLPKAKSNTKDKPYQKPDIDKLARAVLDALTQSGIIADDSLVTKLGVTKRWADDTQEPGVFICISDDLYA